MTEYGESLECGHAEATHYTVNHAYRTYAQGVAQPYSGDLITREAAS